MSIYDNTYVAGEKPFDITQYELDNHLTELESGNLGVNDCGWIIDKESAIAIARHFKLTADDEDDQKNN